jgi:hypothetical protein
MIDVKELRELYEAGTKGEWIVENPISHPGVQVVTIEGYFDWICHVQVSNRPNWRKDSTLITAMHNAMPEILKMAEWCAGRCVTCALFGQECPKERFSSTPLWADHGPCPEWKPAWEL